MSARNEKHGFEKVTRRKKRKSRLPRIALLVFVVGVLLIAAIPYLLSSSSVVNYGIATFGGLDPVKVNVGSIKVGWFSPARIETVLITDSHGDTVADIESIETEISLWRAITNLGDLGTITIRKPVAEIEIQPGGSSIEMAFEHLISDQPSDPSESVIAGRIVVKNAQATLVDSITNESWQVNLDSVSSQLPIKNEMIGKTRLVGIVRPVQVEQQNAKSTEGRFEITINPLANDGTSPAQGVSSAALAGTNSSTNGTGTSFSPLSVDILAEDLPIGFSSLLKRRLPELPFESAQGRLSASLRGSAYSPSRWQITADSFRARDLKLAAADLLGPNGSQLNKIDARGQIEMMGSKMAASGVNLTSDVGTLTAKADVPWPIELPTATQPWIPDATLDINGQIDVAQLMAVLPDVLVQQQGTRVTQGNITLRASQSIGTDGLPTGKYELKLGNLIAMVSGRQIDWANALQATVDVVPTEEGQPKFTANVDSEFCSIDGQGDYHGGQVNIIVDLDQFHKRLSDWVVMPIDKLSGTAQLKTDWIRASETQFVTRGNIYTSPLVIQLPSGIMEEPSWEGEFEIAGQTNGSQLQQLDRTFIKLVAQSESLIVNVLEPISMIAVSPEIQSLPPAPADIRLTGDLARWLQRGEVIAGMDFGIELAGACELNLAGNATANGIQLKNADWKAEPFIFESAGVRFKESQMIGNFAGVVDTNNIANLVVDKCIIQSETFAMSARDEAGPNGSRVGQANYAANPNRLLAAAQGVGSTGVADIQAEGQLTGAMNWAIDSETIQFDVDGNGQQLAFYSLANSPVGQLASAPIAGPTGTNVAQRELMWQEPQAQFQLTGEYGINSGNLDMSQTVLRTEWIAYSGTAEMTSVDVNGESQTKVSALGKCVYDAQAVTTRLKPMIGEHVEMNGVREEPVELTWVSSSNGNWAENLNVQTKIGWDAASVLGIDLGASDVGLVVENGHFVSQAEIPVSQGALRWSLDGQLADEQIAIRQSPQMVLDNVAITPEMCQGWLKYVAPILAEVTQVEGNLSLDVSEALITPTDLNKQRVAGFLRVHNATVGPGPLANQFITIVQQVRAIRNGNLAGAANPQQTWLTMPDQRINFAVDSGRVLHRDLRINAGEFVLTTTGSINLSGQIDMVAALPVDDDWIASTPALESLRGQSLQIPIGGTVQRPQVDMRVFSNLATQLASNAAQGFIQKQVDRGLNKLLGPMQERLQGLPNSGDLVPEGVLPKGLIPNNLFPGFGSGN